MILRTSLQAQLLTLALLGRAAAYTTPTAQCTNGCNPISKPSLQELVPVSAPYTITWNPTTAGTVTILLLQGPSTNVVPLYSIAEKIANNGAFSWTPSADLQPDISHYGLQLIDDSDGSFQYSTQFGISNTSKGNSSSVAAVSTISATSSTSPTITNMITSTRQVIQQTPSSTQQSAEQFNPTTTAASAPSSTDVVAPSSSDLNFLSTGLKAAIGVGVTALVCGLVIFAVLALLRRRKRAKIAEEDKHIPMDGQRPWKSLD